MDICAEGIHERYVDYEDGYGQVKDYSCTHDDTLFSSEVAGDEQPDLVNLNLANGIVLYHAPQPDEPEEPEPPTQTESCATTLYLERDCDYGLLVSHDLT